MNQVFMGNCYYPFKDYDGQYYLVNAKDYQGTQDTSKKIAVAELVKQGDVYICYNGEYARLNDNVEILAGFPEVMRCTCGRPVILKASAISNNCIWEPMRFESLLGMWQTTPISRSEEIKLGTVWDSNGLPYPIFINRNGQTGYAGNKAIYVSHCGTYTQFLPSCHNMWYLSFTVSEVSDTHIIVDSFSNVSYTGVSSDMEKMAEEVIEKFDKRKSGMEWRKSIVTTYLRDILAFEQFEYITQIVVDTIIGIFQKVNAKCSTGLDWLFISAIYGEDRGRVILDYINLGYTFTVNYESDNCISTYLQLYYGNAVPLDELIVLVTKGGSVLI